MSLLPRAICHFLLALLKAWRRRWTLCRKASLAQHIPNLGHAAIFVGFAVMLFFLIELALLMLGLSPVKQSGGAITVQHPMLQIGALAAT